MEVPYTLLWTSVEECSVWGGGGGNNIIRIRSLLPYHIIRNLIQFKDNMLLLSRLVRNGSISKICQSNIP